MKKSYALLFLLMSVFLVKAQTTEEMSQLRSEIEQDLTANILPFWLNNAQDDINGGFYGEISGKGNGDASALKSSILGARILWTFSTAYRVYGLDSYKQMADRMQKYYIQNFIDKRYGGAYWTITPDGDIADATMQPYTKPCAKSKLSVTSP